MQRIRDRSTECRSQYNFIYFWVAFSFLQQKRVMLQCKIIALNLLLRINVCASFHLRFYFYLNVYRARDGVNSVILHIFFFFLIIVNKNCTLSLFICTCIFFFHSASTPLLCPNESFVLLKLQSFKNFFAQTLR